MVIIRKFCLFLVGLMVLFFFGNLNISTVEAKQSCECRPVWEGNLIKQVSEYKIEDNCDTGYEPEWGMYQTGCNCRCVKEGTAKSMPVREDIKVSSVASIDEPDFFCIPKNIAGPGVQTALGCIPVQISGFVTWLLPILFGIAGGISLLLMIWGFILISTSKGDPKTVQGARETITSAITGLLISIFAIFLLRLIAVNILRIPGLL